MTVQIIAIKKPEYIRLFIKEHGYAPSYREIKAGLSYSSIGTVAHHVDQLLILGLLRKREKSARSIELVETDALITTESVDSHKKWLINQIDMFFNFVEKNNIRKTEDIQKLTTLIEALTILEMSPAATAFRSRLSNLKKTTEQ